MVFICALFCVYLWFYCRGLSVSATPGDADILKKRRTRMLSPRKPIFAFSKRMKCGWHDTEGYASLPPRLRATRCARAFDLSGRAAAGILHGFSRIVCDWILPRIFTELGADFHNDCVFLWFYCCGAVKRVIFILSGAGWRSGEK